MTATTSPFAAVALDVGPLPQLAQAHGLQVPA